MGERERMKKLQSLFLARKRILSLGQIEIESILQRVVKPKKKERKSSRANKREGNNLLTIVLRLELWFGQLAE